MPARIRTERELAVIFSRAGENPETRIVPNGHRAAIVAVMLIAQRAELRDGDQLLVQNYEET
jgi:hypothetical protein